MGRLGDAETAYRRAILLKPDYASAHNSLSLALKELGRLAESRQAVEEAIRLAPRRAMYLHNLSTMERFAAGDRRVTAMQALAADATSLSAAERIYLHFALAKAHEDDGPLRKRVPTITGWQ